MNILKNKFRFTLVELVIVIAVLAILASLLLPSIRKATESGYTIVCKNNLKQTNTYSELYLNDNNLIMVPSSNAGSFLYKSWVWNLSFYMSGWEPGKRTTRAPEEESTFLICPSTPEPFGDNYNTSSVTQTNYSYNLYSGDTHFRGRPRSKASPFSVVHFVNVSSPSEAIGFLDNRYLWHRDNHFVYDETHIETGAKTYLHRHLGGNNRAYLDGHVEYGLLLADNPIDNYWYKWSTKNGQ